MAEVAEVDFPVLGNQLQAVGAAVALADHLETAVMVDQDISAVYQQTLAAEAAVETVVVARVKAEVRLLREAIIFLVSEVVVDLPQQPPEAVAVVVGDLIIPDKRAALAVI
jgi:hypothetical protein